LYLYVKTTNRRKNILRHTLKKETRVKRFAALLSATTNSSKNLYSFKIMIKDSIFLDRIFLTVKNKNMVAYFKPLA